MSWARKWLAPGTISVRSPAGSAQLRSDSMAIVTAWDQASTLRSRVLGDTSDGANCLRAVTTSHIESPHRPLSSRRRATSATACWPRSDWSRASRYTVVLRQSESAACGGRTEANHRIHASFIERSEEHTSELQSLMRISYAVFCLKKKNKTIIHNKHPLN